jgi:hypothetical protein
LCPKNRLRYIADSHVTDHREDVPGVDQSPNLLVALGPRHVFVGVVSFGRILEGFLRGLRLG